MTPAPSNLASGKRVLGVIQGWRGSSSTSASASSGSGSGKNASPLADLALWLSPQLQGRVFAADVAVGVEDRVAWQERNWQAGR